MILIHLSDKVSAEDWDKETEPFKKNSTKNEWIGCIGSEPIYRGYSCGLWTLFHYLLSEGTALYIPSAVIKEFHKFISRRYYLLSGAHIECGKMIRTKHTKKISDRKLSPTR